MNETLTTDRLRSELLQVFQEHAAPGAEVRETSHISSDLGIDSLTVMEVVAAIEDRYNVVLPDDDLPAMRTVGDVIHSLGGHLRTLGRLSE
jgi:acyl carrier protein